MAQVQNGYYIRKFGRKIKGKDVLTSLPFITEMAIQMLAEGEHIRMMYNQTTKTWNHIPYFYVNLQKYKQNPPLISAEDFYSKQIHKKERTQISKYEHRATIESMEDFASNLLIENADSFTLVVYTDDKIYAYVDGGTEKRYALMSFDWESKTKPGVLQPGYGEGVVELWGKGYKKVFGDNPRPGIVARNFSAEIYKLENPIFRRDMNNAAKRGARRLSKYMGWSEGKLEAYYRKYGRF